VNCCPADANPWEGSNPRGRQGSTGESQLLGAAYRHLGVGGRSAVRPISPCHHTSIAETRVTGGYGMRSSREAAITHG
jgi:hypothetical protein